MTAPRAVATPVQRDWRCTNRACRAVLGRVTGSNDLVVTAKRVMVERGRLGTIVRCECGASKAFDGRRVILDGKMTTAT